VITAVGRLLCRLGRHDREYLYSPSSDLVVVWCPRCKNPKAAEVFPAKRIGNAPAGAKAANPDRPLGKLDHDALTAAIGMLAALARLDDQGFDVLRRHSDPLELTFSLVFLANDALAEPATDDLGAYADQMFERLARRRQ
jgi:hypothetical protein